MGCWVLKTLRMKSLETWSHLKTGILEIIYKMKFGKIFFKIKEDWRKGKMTRGSWVTCIRWPCKTGRACGSSAHSKVNKCSNWRWARNTRILEWVLSSSYADEPATVKGVIASQSTQFSWPDMAPIRLFPSASCMCAWPSYVHSLLVHQTCRNQDSQWCRQFEFQLASPHPCTNEQWIPLPTNQTEMKEWGNGESSNHNFKRSLQGIGCLWNWMGLIILTLHVQLFQKVHYVDTKYPF